MNWSEKMLKLKQKEGSLRRVALLFLTSQQRSLIVSVKKKWKRWMRRGLSMLLLAFVFPGFKVISIFHDPPWINSYLKLSAAEFFLASSWCLCIVITWENMASRCTASLQMPVFFRLISPPHHLWFAKWRIK